MSFVTLNYVYFNLNRNIEMVSLIGKQKEKKNLITSSTTTETHQRRDSLQNVKDNN